MSNRVGPDIFVHLCAPSDIVETLMGSEVPSIHTHTPFYCTVELWDNRQLLVEDIASKAWSVIQTVC